MYLCIYKHVCMYFGSMYLCIYVSIYVSMHNSSSRFVSLCYKIRKNQRIFHVFYNSQKLVQICLILYAVGLPTLVSTTFSYFSCRTH